jgi:hypothetical protein
VADEIAAFGFDVAGTPVAGNRYDIVIALPDDTGRHEGLDLVASEAARMLRPGGMLLGAWRGDALSVATSAWRSLFDPRLVLIGERSERGWEVREHDLASARKDAAGRPRANVMIQALRLDAPGR